MKLISWNVNGFRAVMKKGFSDYFNDLDADIFCIQETKLQKGQHEFEPAGYFQYWNYAQKKGYSGTAIWTKQKPISVKYNIDYENEDNVDREGRVITLEFDQFYLVNVYTPNSKNELLRLNERMGWEDAFRTYLIELDQKKPIILCGDLNVAHNDIDLKNPANNHNNPGFSDEERNKFTDLLNAGFTDTFRHFHPDEPDRYSWWSYRFKARERNAGWRIDYFVTSKRINDRLISADILDQIYGSDHCPVLLNVEF